MRKYTYKLNTRMLYLSPEILLEVTQCLLHRINMRLAFKYCFRLYCVSKVKVMFTSHNNRHATNVAHVMYIQLSNGQKAQSYRQDTYNEHDYELT